MPPSEFLINAPYQEQDEGMPIAILPSEFHNSTNDRGSDVAWGGTVGEVLRNLEARGPRFYEFFRKNSYIDVTGHRSWHLAVYKNGDPVIAPHGEEFQDGLQTPVGESDAIAIVPMECVAVTDEAEAPSHRASPSRSGPTVLLPRALRRIDNGEAEYVLARGRTVGEVLRHVEGRGPKFHQFFEKNSYIDLTGSRVWHFSVYLNEDSILGPGRQEFKEGLQTAVGENDVVTVVPV